VGFESLARSSVYYYSGGLLRKRAAKHNACLGNRLRLLSNKLVLNWCMGFSFAMSVVWLSIG
jgi:hypothetical protein